MTGHKYAAETGLYLVSQSSLAVSPKTVPYNNTCLLPPLASLFHVFQLGRHRLCLSYRSTVALYSDISSKEYATSLALSQVFSSGLNFNLSPLVTQNGLYSN